MDSGIHPDLGVTNFSCFIGLGSFRRPVDQDPEDIVMISFRHHMSRGKERDVVTEGRLFRGGPEPIAVAGFSEPPQSVSWPVRRPLDPNRPPTRLGVVSLGYLAFAQWAIGRSTRQNRILG